MSGMIMARLLSFSAALLFTIGGAGAIASAGETYRFSLDGAIAQALRANRSVLSSSSLVTESRLSLENALSFREWKFFPGTYVEYGSDDEGEEDEGLFIGADLSLKRRTGTSGEFEIGPHLRKGAGAYESGVSVSLLQPLLRGAGNAQALNEIHGAEYSLRNSRRALYLRHVAIVISTVTSYYNVLRQGELITLRQELVGQLQGHSEAAEAKKKFGLANPIDAYRARSELKRVEDALVTATEGHRRAEDELKLLLALPLEAEIVIEAVFDYELVSLDVEEAVETALANRVELDQTRDFVLERERLSRLARNNALPDLTLLANYSSFDEDERFSESFGFEDYRWDIRFSSRTDWARSEEHRALEQSLISLERSRLQMREREEEIILELKRELFSLSRLEEKMTIQRERIGEAEGQLELAKVKYRHRLSDNFDLIDAESRLEEAETNLVFSIIDYIVGTYRLREALGTLLEVPSDMRSG